jgi:hypothetical protein
MGKRERKKKIPSNCRQKLLHSVAIHRLARTWRTNNDLTERHALFSLCKPKLQKKTRKDGKANPKHSKPTNDNTLSPNDNKAMNQKTLENPNPVIYQAAAIKREFIREETEGEREEIDSLEIFGSEFPFFFFSLPQPTF